MSINKNAKFYKTERNLSKKEAYKMAKTNKKMYFGKEISDMMKMFD